MQTIEEPTHDALAAAVVALNLPTPEYKQKRTTLPLAYKAVRLRLRGVLPSEMALRLKRHHKTISQCLQAAGGRNVGRHWWISEANLAKLGIPPKRALKLGAVPSNGGFFAHVPTVQN